MVTRQIEVVVALRALDNVSGVLGRIGGSFSNLGRQLRATGTALSIGLTLPLLGLGRAVIDAAGTFEDQLIRMQIASRATEDEMKILEQAALNFGQTTIFSATDSAEAMIDMFKAGLTLEQILGEVEGQIGGMAAAAQLAAASDLDLEEATSAVISSLAKMGLEFDSSTELIDSFVAAADASLAEVSDLTDAWKNAGNTLRGFGFEINDINLAFAVLSQQGLQGAEAGTRLRRMLTNMMRDTNKVQSAWEELGFSFFTSEGEMRPMIDVIEDLNGALAGMTEEQANLLKRTLAGSHGIDTLNALLNAGVEEWDRLGAEMDDVRSAQEIATARTESLQGQMKILQDTIQNLLIKAGTPLIEEFLKPATKFLQELAVQVQDGMNPEMVRMFGVFALLLTVLGPAVFLLGALLSPMGILIGLVAALGASFVNAAGGIEPAIELIGEKLGGALERVRVAFDELKTGDISGAFEALGAPEPIVAFFEDVETAIANLAQFWEDNGDAILGAFSDIGEFIAGLAGAGGVSALDALGEAIVNATQWIVDNGPQIAERLQDVADTITQDLIPGLSDLSDWASDNKDQIIGVALGIAGAFLVIAGVINPIFGLVAAIVGIAAAFGGLDSLVEGAKALFMSFVETVKPAWDEFLIALQDAGFQVEGIQDVFQLLGGIIGGVIAVAVGLLAGLVSAFLKVMTFGITAFASIRESGKQLLSGIWSIVQGIIMLFQPRGTLRESIAGLGEAFGLIASGVVETIMAMLTLLSQIFITNLAGIWLIISGFVEGVINFFKDLAQRLVGGSIVPEMMQDIVDAIVGGIDEAISILGDKVTEMVDLGRDLLQGLWDGLLEKWKEIEEWWNDTAGQLITIYNQVTGRGSPAREFIALGEDIMSGLQLGLQRGSMGVHDLSGRIASGIPNEFFKQIQPVGGPLDTGLAAAPITVNVNVERVSDDVDVEMMARRIAEVISQRQRVGGGRF